MNEEAGYALSAIRAAIPLIDSTGEVKTYERAVSSSGGGFPILPAAAGACLCIGGACLTAFFPSALMPVGLIAVSVVCAGPLALLCVKRFLFKAVAAAAEAVQNPRLQKLFSCVGSAAGMLMGLLGCNAMMLFLSFTAAMKAVSA